METLIGNIDTMAPVAWLIMRCNASDEISREVVMSPLTDDHYMDEGDEAWPLYILPTTTPTRQEVERMLIAVARAAHTLCDGACEDGEGEITVDRELMEDLSKSLDPLEDLPEISDQVYGSGPAKAEHLLLPNA